MASFGLLTFIRAYFALSESLRFSNIERIASQSLSLGNFASSSSIRLGPIFALFQSKWPLASPLAMRLCAPAGS